MRDIVREHIEVPEVIAFDKMTEKEQANAIFGMNMEAIAHIVGKKEGPADAEMPRPATKDEDLYPGSPSDAAAGLFGQPTKVKKQRKAKAKTKAKAKKRR